MREAATAQKGSVAITDNASQMAEDLILTNPLPDPLQAHISAALSRAGGWLPFDEFMALALYSPGLGYYARSNTQIGMWPQPSKAEPREHAIDLAGSDFVTAPELTPLFGKALARQVAQALAATATVDIWEFGAGTGALALQILQTLDALGCPWEHYTIVELSAALRQRQQTALAPFAGKVRWVDALPEAFSGIVVGNEVLDAMPVKLLVRNEGEWFERGVCVGNPWVWQDRPTALRPPLDVDGDHDYLTEIHLQAEAFIRTLAERLNHGAVFLIDYGFPEHEYYLAQRHMGTLMCHRAHQADSEPLRDVGLKDITAHVNFTGVALAAQEAGFDLLGYTSQARFLMNCGLLELLETATFADKAMAQKLLMEHEMGELFKVIGWCKPAAMASTAPTSVAAQWQAIGFAQGDRSHRL